MDTTTTEPSERDAAGRPPVPAESRQAFVGWMDWLIRRYLERQALQEQTPAAAEPAA